MITRAQYEAAYQEAMKKSKEFRPVASRNCRTWLAFHRANEQVFETLIALIREAKQCGFNKWSMSAAYEVARWEHRLDLASREKFKLNNIFQAYYARAIMMSDPSLFLFLETRKSGADTDLGWNWYKTAMKRAEKENRNGVVDRQQASNLVVDAGARP
jgi:hypothetical protein